MDNCSLKSHRVLSSAPEAQDLLLVNRSKLHKLFIKHISVTKVTSTSKVMAYSDFFKFCKALHIFPDLLTTKEVERLLG